MKIDVSEFPFLPITTWEHWGKKPRKVTNNMIPNNHNIYAYTMIITPKNISKIPSLIGDACNIFKRDFSK